MVLIEIQQLVDLYVKHINDVINGFLTLFGEKNPSKLWRQGLINRTGFLDNNKTEFSFHGAGCTVEFKNGEIVSFDFLEDDTFTFDLFKFKTFVLSKLSDEEKVNEIFKKIEIYNDGGQWRVKETI